MKTEVTCMSESYSLPKLLISK